MFYSMGSRLVTWSTAILLVVAIGSINNAAYAQKKDKGADKTAQSGRLPPYYKEIVTAEQKDQIYKIQTEYKAKIDAAIAQYHALTKEQATKIEALLTPEQKQKLDQLKSAPKPKRSAKAAANKPKPDADAK